MHKHIHMNYQVCKDTLFYGWGIVIIVPILFFFNHTLIYKHNVRRNDSNTPFVNKKQKAYTLSHSVGSVMYTLTH